MNFITCENKGIMDHIQRQKSENSNLNSRKGWISELNRESTNYIDDTVNYIDYTNKLMGKLNGILDAYTVRQIQRIDLMITNLEGVLK
jgi:hypothetical protein